MTDFIYKVTQSGADKVITLGNGSTATLQPPSKDVSCNFESFSTTQDARTKGVSYCLMKALLQEAVEANHPTCTVKNVHFALHKTLANLDFRAENWRDEPMGRPKKLTAKQIQGGNKNFDFTTLPPVSQPDDPSHNCADYRCDNPGQALHLANIILVRYSHTCARRRGGCFITTAACEVMGLADDCDDLQTLRRYRDQCMMTTEQGRSEVAEYYRIAPEYLARIYACDDAAGVLRDIYNSAIRPAVAAVQAGQTDLAHGIYFAMVRNLGNNRFGAS